jgi:hypothetical protein
MRIKALRTASFNDVAQSIEYGNEYDMPKAEAERYVKAGYAEAIGTPKKETKPEVKKAAMKSPSKGDDVKSGKATTAKK